MRLNYLVTAVDRLSVCTADLPPTRFAATSGRVLMRKLPLALIGAASIALAWPAYRRAGRGLQSADERLLGRRMLKESPLLATSAGSRHL
jgi:hypothetical protein